MRTILTTMLCIALTGISYGQLGNTNKKIASKNIGASISVKSTNKTLKQVKIPRNLDMKKLPALKVPKGKLAAPRSGKSTRITPLKPYTQNLQLIFVGRYSSKYLVLGGFKQGPLDGPTGLITFNAQRGKEYRMKISLSHKKDLVKDFQKDFAEGDVAISIGGQTNWQSIPVNHQNREINLVFTASQAGPIQFFISGIYTPDWNWNKVAMLPIRAIVIDEI